MNEKETLILLIKRYINHIKNNFEINNPQNFNEELCISLSEKIKLIKSDTSKLSVIDTKQIKNILPNFNNDELITLEFYKSVMSTSFSMTQYDNDILKNIIEKIGNELMSYTEKINNYKKERESKLSEAIKKYQTILDKINSNFDLEKDDVELIYEMLKTSNLEIENSIKIMRFIANETLRTNLVNEDEEEIQIIEDSNLSYEVLEELFNKYNFSMSMFDREEQNELQKYGNIINIEKILSKLSEYNIDISEYLVNRSTAISKMLIYSNPDLVENLFQTFIKYGIVKRDENNNVIYINGKNMIDFDILLSRPSQFLKRKKKWARRDKGGKIDTNFEGPSGCQEDLIKNIEYFAKEGLDVGRAYEKSSYYFCLPHEHIVEVVKTFDLYGISKEKYLKTLSSFMGNNQADCIDMFIELGYLNYLKNNLSRFSLAPNSPMFYKLAKAKQLGITPRSYGKGLDSAITYDSRQYLGIDKNNGSKITEQYVFDFEGKDYLDRIIETNPNNSISVVLEVQKKLINLLDSNYLKIEENGYPNYRLYNINGVMISRTKFLRIFNTLIVSGINPSVNSIMYALTKNSIITKEECDIVYSEITNLYNKLHKEGELKR